MNSTSTGGRLTRNSSSVRKTVGFTDVNLDSTLSNGTVALTPLRNQPKEPHMQRQVSPLPEAPTIDRREGTPA